MLLDAVLLEYQTKLEALQGGIGQARMSQTSAGVVLALSVVLFCGLALMAVQRRVPFWYPPLPMPVAAASLRRYLRGRSAWLRQWRLKRFYQRGVARLQGFWAGAGVGGEEYTVPNHVYEKDLHVLGEASLFELLCTTRTEIGRRRLAHYLLEPASHDEISARQQAIQELAPRTDLREKTALLGRYEFQESKWETFAEWINSPLATFPAWLAPIALVTAAALACLLLTGYGGQFTWSYFLRWIAPLIAFHFAIGFALGERTRAIRNSVRSVGSEIGVFSEGLELFTAQDFRSEKLRRIVAQVRRGPGPRSIRRLERMLRALEKCDQDAWFYLPSRILLVDTQLCMAVERWRAVHGAALQRTLDAWAEFEALNALATYAHEHPDDVYPELVDGPARFEAESLGHPLLPLATCVRNDIALNEDSRFYLVSGSNMAGKSTLLRTIGLNAVLAFAGAPVRALRLRISPLAICASLSLVDSLEHGKSRFLAEVDRLRRSLEAALHGPALFLIDEILSGTNSRDRRIAAEAVVRVLVERNAIGALSTHDLALTEIAALEPLRGMNVHMGCRDGADPLDFDYRLKPGVTQESNALAIARLAGVPV